MNLSPQPIGVFFEDGEHCVIVPVTNFAKGGTLFGPKVSVKLTTEPSGCVSELVSPAFHVAGKLVNPLEVPFDLSLGGVAEKASFVPITIFLRQTGVWEIGSIRMLCVADSFPVFDAERTITDVFVFDSHVGYENLLHVSSHTKENQLCCHVHKLVEPKGIDPLSHPCEG